MKKLLLTIVATLAFGVAHADLTNLSDWDKSITVNSDNRQRGISENQAKPGLVLAAEQNLSNGFYVGTKIPTVSGNLGYGFHVDPYAGYKFKPVEGLTVDIGTMNYLFPKVTKYVTNEFYTNVSYSIFTVKASRSLGNYFSYPNSEGTTYYEVGLDYPINDKFKVHAHVGKVDIANNTFMNYQTQQVGATYKYSKEWSVTGTYIENKNLTDIAKNYGFIENGHALWKNTFIVSLTKSF
jgi:uncharacterized protein (TIGR02001 family)